MSVNLYEFGDLLNHATTLGYDWNVIHDILVEDEIPPMYESKKHEIYLCDLEDNEYDYGKDTLKVLMSFMEKEDIANMVIV